MKEISPLIKSELKPSKMAVLHSIAISLLAYIVPDQLFNVSLLIALGL